MEPTFYETVYRLQHSHWWYLARQRFFNILLRQVKRRGKVLDAGCGPGSMLHYLTTYGDVTGLDRYLPALSMARSHFAGPLVQGTLDQLPFPGGEFSLVNVSEVLYHRNVPEVRTAVAELVRVLSPGGLLLIVDSAYPSLASEHDQVAHGVRRFTREMLVKECQEAGLEVLHATYAYAVLLPIVWLLRRWKAKRPSKAILRQELKPVPWLINCMLIGWFSLESQIAGRWGLPFGLSVQVVARKPIQQ